MSPICMRYPVAVGKQIAYMRIDRDEQDRQVHVGFTDGTELAIDWRRE